MSNESKQRHMGYVADFETNKAVIKDGEVIRKASVWAWCVTDIRHPNITYYGSDIDTFMEWCERNVKKSTIKIYFHNLRFDSSFIIDWLERHDHHCINNNDDKQEGSYSVLIDGLNNFYNMELIYKFIGDGNGKVRKVGVKFIDSLKIIPQSVRSIARGWGLEVQKGHIDYEAYREPGQPLSQADKDYITNDCLIVAAALKTFFEDGYYKETLASNCFKTFTDIYSSTRRRGKRKRNYRDDFPEIEFDDDKELRKAYHGGWCYCNPKYQTKEVDHGMVFDVNSLYPWAMRNNIYPCGYPQFFGGKYEYDKLYPMHIQTILCEFKVKPGYLPTIQIKDDPRYKPTEYLVESKGETYITLCDVDLELFFEHYDVTDLHYVSGYKFMKMDSPFTDYIDKFMEIKKESKGAKRAIAKLFLNSLYGKFATALQRVNKKSIFNEESDSIEFILDEETIGKGKYIPVGIWCTAYARNKTIRTAQKCIDKFIYSDTDSIHIMGDEIPEAIKDEVDPKELGYWKLESHFSRGKFLKAKTYVEEEELTKEEYEERRETELNDLDEYSKLFYERDNKYYHLDVKCAGMPARVKENVTYENFKVGFSSPGKLIPVMTPGGVTLEDRDFTINKFELNKSII